MPICMYICFVVVTKRDPAALLSNLHYHNLDNKSKFSGMYGIVYSFGRATLALKGMKRGKSLVRYLKYVSGLINNCFLVMANDFRILTMTAFIGDLWYC